MLFKGSGVAIVTPFKNGEVNYKKLAELIEYQIKNHTDAIIVCGTTGESATLSKEEKQKVITYTVERVKKRVPVIAGTGSNNTKQSIEMSQFAESVGVDGLLLVTPYYNKTTQKGLVNHYTAIADSVKIPNILYNVPGRTGININPKTVQELSKHPQIVAVKEASGDIAQVAQVANLCDDEFIIYSGNDELIVPILSLGGHGVISVVANIIPQDTHDLVEAYLTGKVNEARRLQLKMLDLINTIFIETNPIPIKTAMNVLGMDVGECRLPLVEMELHHLNELKDQMKRYGLEFEE